MKTDTNFKFPVSLSTVAYKTKEEQTAAITSRSECRRIGLREKMAFSEVAVTIPELLDYCIHGRTFCNLFTSYPTSEGRTTYQRKDGSFTLAAKADRFFAGSWTLCVDIDETAYTSLSDFLDRLPLKPSLWYTSFSNAQSGKGLRFRLVYVLDERVGGKYFFRYCVAKLNTVIERATGEEIHDKCNLRASQYFNGTNIDTPGVVSEYGQTGIVYSLTDIIGCDLEDYEYFLACELQRKDITEQDEERILSDLDPDLFCCDHSPDPAFSVDSELFHDSASLDYDAFQIKWRRQFAYIYRCEYDEREPWRDGYYKLVGPCYFQLYYNTKKVPVGGGRKAKLLQRSCLRRLMKPWTTASELYWNLYEDCFHPRKAMVDLSDGAITARTLKRIAQKAMGMRLREIVERWSENIEWLIEHTRPKDGIIVNPKADCGMYSGTGGGRYAHRKAREAEHEAGRLEVSRSTDYRIRKEKGEARRKVSDEELRRYLDPSQSALKNREHVVSLGIAASRSRITKLLAEMKTKADVVPQESRLTHADATSFPGISYSVPTFTNFKY